MATVIEETHVSAHRGHDKERGGVSWGAVIAGAVAATALTLILLILGTGIGFASVSPWANEGASAEAIGVSTVVWVTLVSLVASAIGGYIAGRLRPRWARIHSDEVYFRDTAHGFLAWALGTLLMATLLSSAVGNIISGGAKVGAAAVGGAAATVGVAASGEDADGEGASSYLFDRVFRRSAAANQTSAYTTLDENAQPRVVSRPAQSTGKEARMEAARIFINGVANDGLPAADKQYLSQVVAREAGITEAEASQRIDEAYGALVQAKQEAKEAADKAADVAAYTALWLFISLLLGAFVASLMATRGGVCRDRACLDDTTYTNTRVETVRPRV